MSAIVYNETKRKECIGAYMLQKMELCKGMKVIITKQKKLGLFVTVYKETKRKECFGERKWNNVKEWNLQWQKTSLAFLSITVYNVTKKMEC